MNRYQLATLVKWAGTLHTRKRLQKVVYLLQAAGCELEVGYTLHHYGPYSPDVASLTDEMLRAGLLHEQASMNPVGGRSYSYTLPQHVQDELDRLAQDPDSRRRLGHLGDYEELAQRLLNVEEVRKLEFAATVAYFHAREPNESWDHAREAAAKFKGHTPSDPAMREAEQLARDIVGKGCHG